MSFIHGRFSMAPVEYAHRLPIIQAARADQKASTSSMTTWAAWLSNRIQRRSMDRGCLWAMTFTTPKPDGVAGESRNRLTTGTAGQSRQPTQTAQRESLVTAAVA